MGVSVSVFSIDRLTCRLARERLSEPLQDRQFNGPGPNILGRLGVVNISFCRVSVLTSSLQEPLHFAARLRATAGLGPDWATSEPKDMRSLQRPPKRTQGEARQVMR